MIQKIDGWNGNVIPGDPVNGDLVRVTENGQVCEYRYTDTTPDPKPQYPTLTPSKFFGVVLAALGPVRTKALFGDDLVKTALTIANTIDRNKGNTPGLIAYLQGLQTNPLTNDELTAIETAWKAL